MKPTLFAAAIAALLSLTQPAIADKSDWAEGTSIHNDGANREYYNRAAVLPWANFMGDWCDATDGEQGDAAYAVTKVVDDDSAKSVEWNVTALVKQWTDLRFPNQGMFLRVVDGSGPIIFDSRESKNGPLRPKLTLVGKGGAVSLDPIADTYLTKSTYRSQGQSEQLRVSNASDHILIRFDLKEAKRVGEISKATLVLHTSKQYGSVRIGVFRCRQGHNEPPSDPILGLAARYPQDRGLDKDAAVIFASGFESPKWQDEWTQVAPQDKIDTVEPNTGFLGFESMQGSALRARIAKGSTTALDTLYKFAKQTGSEPEEVYFRYYLRLADDWNQTVQGGKLPGISGTYGRAGWGGRKSNGRNGWSARGLFKLTIPEGNPLANTTPIGFYCYHADMESPYGTNWVWTTNYCGYLTTNRWYAIEQQCRLNTAGERDGILRGWVDGQLAFEKTDVRFRLTDELKIEQIWMNVYHGGTVPSPYDQHLFIDNVVIARRYIGPMVSSDLPAK